MTLLPDSDLEYMRASIEGLLPGSCNILSATLASDGAGGMTPTWGTVGTAIACRLDAIRGNENIQGASVAPEHAYVLTLAHDTDIDTGIVGIDTEHTLESAADRFVDSGQRDIGICRAVKERTKNKKSYNEVCGV